MMTEIRSHAISDVNKAVQHHDTVTPNLVGAHALSGCDMTQYPLAGKGKKTAFKI